MAISFAARCPAGLPPSALDQKNHAQTPIISDTMKPIERPTSHRRAHKPGGRNATALTLTPAALAAPDALAAEAAAAL